MHNLVHLYVCQKNLHGHSASWGECTPTQICEDVHANKQNHLQNCTQLENQTMHGTVCIHEPQEEAMRRSSRQAKSGPRVRSSLRRQGLLIEYVLSQT